MKYVCFSDLMTLSVGFGPQKFLFQKIFFVLKTIFGYFRMQESVHLDGQVVFAGDLCVIWAAFLLFLLRFLLRFCLKHSWLGLGQFFSMFRSFLNFLLTNYCCQFFSAFFCSKITGVGFFSWTSFMRSLARFCCCSCWVGIIKHLQLISYMFCCLK